MYYFNDPNIVSFRNKSLVARATVAVYPFTDILHLKRLTYSLLTLKLLGNY